VRLPLHTKGSFLKRGAGSRGLFFSRIDILFPLSPWVFPPFPREKPAPPPFLARRSSQWCRFSSTGPPPPFPISQG